ncbi:MAG: 4Fe-4S dicluster domain-containing protein [Candidatus Bipolaricaulota bacterium]
MGIYKMTDRNFISLLDSISSDRELFVPTNDQEETSYKRWDNLGSSAVHFPKYRLNTPVKTFFFPPKESVSRFPSGDFKPERDKRAIFGLKQCDLASLKVLDQIFLDDEIIDPFYATRRQDTLLISSDCYETLDTCFCNKVEGQPFPKDGFDLNLIKLPGEDDLLVEIADESSLGKEVYEANQELFDPAPENLLEKLSSSRRSMEEQLDENNDFFEIPEDVGNISPKHPVWRGVAEDCVECGACTMICPTCHCFQLYEQTEDSTVNRGKVWDSCSFEGYSRVAGGANPMESLESRVRNRFYDKFGRFYENHDFYGCTGCGRCIESCMGEIDMRDVLKEVSVANQS